MRTAFHTLVTIFTVLLCASQRIHAGESDRFLNGTAKKPWPNMPARAGRNFDPTLTLDLGGGVKWEGVLIPAGTFVMGSPAGEAKSEKESAIEKQHKVTLTQPFYMGKLETTQAQCNQKVTGTNPEARRRRTTSLFMA